MTDDQAPRLAITDGFVIDELAIDRLRHQLDRSPVDVVAIAAMAGTLTPGSSVHAETQRSALRPLDDLIADPRHAPVLLARAGVPVVDGAVPPDAGTVLLDRGAFARDIRAPSGPLLAASIDARPVFPARPVVLFLAVSPDPDAATWAATLADELAALEVDARVAVPEPVSPCRSFRPCLPGPETVRALDPHVVVALDGEALDALDGWIPDDRRATIVVAFEADLPPTPTLVSWRIGSARDRLRARVGPGTSATDLAALVNRLCSGPQPRPPILRLSAQASAALDGHGEHLTVVVLTGALDGIDDRGRGFAEAARAAGHRVEVANLTISIPPAAVHADLVVMRSVTECETVAALLEARADTRLPTILDIGPGDVHFDPALGLPTPTARVERLATQCGLVTTVSSTVAQRFEQMGIDVLVLPNLSTGVDLGRGAHENRASPIEGAPLLGWQIDASDANGTDAIAAALRDLLDRRPDLIVQVVAEPEDVPARIAGHARVALTPDEAGALEHWVLQLWSPAPSAFDQTGNLAPVLDAAAAGVPTVVDAQSLLGADAAVKRAVCILEEPDRHGWFTMVDRLLDEPDLRTVLVRRTHDMEVQTAARSWTDGALSTLIDWARPSVEADR